MEHMYGTRFTKHIVSLIIIFKDLILFLYRVLQCILTKDIQLIV